MCVYVCISRGVFHTSVFYQFSGGVGPVALTCDNQGNLVVGRLDLGTAAEGLITVLSPQGQALAQVPTPNPRITGLALDQQSDYLYDIIPVSLTL